MICSWSILRVIVCKWSSFCIIFRCTLNLFGDVPLLLKLFKWILLILILILSLEMGRIKRRIIECNLISIRFLIYIRLAMYRICRYSRRYSCSVNTDSILFANWTKVLYIVLFRIRIKFWLLITVILKWSLVIVIFLWSRIQFTLVT